MRKLFSLVACLVLVCGSVVAQDNAQPSPSDVQAVSATAVQPAEASVIAQDSTITSGVVQPPAPMMMSAPYMTAQDCGCGQVAPACGCGCSAPVSTGCGCDTCGNKGGRFMNRRSSNCGCNAAPSCGCNTCGNNGGRFMNRRSSNCGCNVAPSCGCAAPVSSCGCETSTCGTPVNTCSPVRVGGQRARIISRPVLGGRRGC